MGNGLKLTHGSLDSLENAVHINVFVVTWVGIQIDCNAGGFNHLRRYTSESHLLSSLPLSPAPLQGVIITDAFSLG